MTPQMKNTLKRVFFICGDYRPSSRMSSHDMIDTHVTKLISGMEAYEAGVEETKQAEERERVRKAGRFKAR